MLEIPEAVLAAPVSAAGKLVWAALQAAMKPGGVIYPAEALAAYLCLPREEVQAALKELTSAGILQAEVSTGRILLVETEVPSEAQVTVTDFEAAVEAFLQAYPEPEGGMPARQSIVGALRDAYYAGADLEEIVDGARRYRQFLEGSPGRPAQDPRRWLQQREWERRWGSVTADSINLAAAMLKLKAANAGVTEEEAWEMIKDDYPGMTLEAVQKAWKMN